MENTRARDRGIQKRVYKSRPGSLTYQQIEFTRRDSDEFAESCGIEKESQVALRYRLHVLNKMFLEPTAKKLARMNKLLSKLRSGKYREIGETSIDEIMEIGSDSEDGQDELAASHRLSATVNGLEKRVKDQRRKSKMLEKSTSAESKEESQEASTSQDS